MILIDKINELRKKKGWLKEELGQQPGESRQAVSKQESVNQTSDDTGRKPTDEEMKYLKKKRFLGFCLEW